MLATAILVAALWVQPSAGQETDPELRRVLAEAIAAGHSFADRFDAEVWLLDMSLRLERRVPETQERLDLLRLVHREAKRVNLPPELVLALIEVESAFDRFAVSVAGAQGLMQIMPFWLKELEVEHQNLFEPQLNIRMGTTILRYYYDMERGDLGRALARYNGSAGQSWYPERVFTALSARWYRE